jgi:hypothetical protein
MQFPHADPIPIPAPVWLMKALSLLTLSLHFFAVQILIGSLVAAIVFSFRGRKDSTQGNSGNITAASVVSRRLPIVMTYVINLGIPPLLFAQVLYGRALYTSSVLIAITWLSVIFLLMGCYWLLYRMSDRSGKGLSIHWHGVGALVIAGGIGDIYAKNMTLMLRPEVWQQMYAKTASGLQEPPHDPTTLPRLLFVLIGGFLIGGLWLCLHSALPTIEANTSLALRKLGTSFALVGAVAELGVGFWIYSVQPESVQQGLHAPIYLISGVIWAVGLIGTILITSTMLKTGTKATLKSLLASTSAFLGIAGAVIVRDGIRDITLFGKGFNVWDRVEASNWWIIGLFLLLFVVGLGVIAWLLMVMKQAKANSEQLSPQVQP